ncbi:MAG TPA: EAL domain-containing protein [Gaiellales bacterium]|nr:EAL domain-containing protein [Gaiellales bacterium]
MLLRRFLIMLVIGGLLAGASAAGYYAGGNGQAAAQRASILRQVGRRLHNKDTAGARLVLAQAFGSGAITGAELRLRNGHPTTVGKVSSSAGSMPLPRGASLRLSTKPPLSGLAHLEMVIAGLLLAVAAAAATAIAIARLLPHLRRPQLPARKARKPQRLPATPALDTEYLARHDALTGLPNRVLLREEAQRRIMRLNGDAMALILMDLNEFKEVNDTLGHFAGDQLLRQVGERLAGFTTESTLVTRLGGDEFAILRSQADAVTAEQLAMRVGESLRRPFLVSGMTLEIDASMGIALAPLHAADYDGLLQRADSAMYAAKRNHTGIAMHTREQEADNSQKLALASDLRRAIEGGQLSLYYQPKATLRTGDISGVEALVRWKHPDRGMISPDQFIPLAERSGLINLLSMWVLKTALRQVADWKRMGLVMPVSVNLSARDLIDVRLPDEIERALHEAKVASELLEVEITESVLTADPARARAIVTRIGELGPTTTIDDFGAGYSSLAYLKNLPVHALKIDRSFVLGMTDNEHDATIVHAVVDLAHNLGLRVVAEGAEDMAVWERLRLAGCDEVQGFVLAQPMPSAQATDWLSRRRQSSNAA